MQIRFLPAEGGLMPGSMRSRTWTLMFGLVLLLWAEAIGGAKRTKS